MLINDGPKRDQPRLLFLIPGLRAGIALSFIVFRREELAVCGILAVAFVVTRDGENVSHFFSRESSWSWARGAHLNCQAITFV